MMALVVGSYYALYLPNSVVILLDLDQKTDFYLQPVFNFVFFMNALINPFIYSWRSKDFNAAYRKLLGIQN